MSLNFTFKRVPAPQVTDAMLADTAALFSSAYGVWGPLAAQKTGRFTKAGSRVKMSAQRLCEQSLSPGTDSELILGLTDDKIAGYAPEHRGKKLATQILRRLREGHDDGGFGILSSHPAAILAALRAWGRGIEDVDLSMTREHAKAVMAASPVNYVKHAKPMGSLFREGEDEDGAVCCADTAFWVDHAEPLAVLAAVKERRDVQWPFGELPEGCEYLVLVMAE
ncbi:Osmotic growth protein [Pestalotiopsis sp. IQ-011]